MFTVTNTGSYAGWPNVFGELDNPKSGAWNNLIRIHMHDERDTILRNAREWRAYWNSLKNRR